MIFVTKSNCAWCVKMKERTFSNKVIKKQLENYILVKIDKNSLDGSLAEVKYFPTTLFYSPNKKLYEKVVGYFKVKDFISWLDDVERMVIK